MNGLRLEIDLAKIAHNAEELVTRAASRGISITGVTKAMLGMPELARVLYDAGASRIGDSRIENIERMRGDGIDGAMLLLRSPAPSQVARVVSAGVRSANTEPQVLSLLAKAASKIGCVHEVMLMVEMGDLREGIMPADLNDTVRHLLDLSSLRLTGIGTNLACRSGVAPSQEKMAELSALVDSVEESFGIEIETVSGGNSANLDWALGSAPVGRVNDLRLGEAILLGCESLNRQPIPGLHTDAVRLIAEAIESKLKPTLPWGDVGQNAFGEIDRRVDRGDVWQTILAVGRNDTELGDLISLTGAEVRAASSDHLIIETGATVRPGDEVAFIPGYAALVRAMTSPFVTKVISVAIAS